VSFWVISSVAR